MALLSHFRAWGARRVLGAALLLVVGVTSLAALGSFAGSCSSARLVAPQPPSSDCGATAPYDLSIIDKYVNPRLDLVDAGGMDLSINVAWFSYGDLTPGAVHTGNNGGRIYAVPIENGGHCGAPYALLLQSYGHNDYGSGFGSYDLGAGQGVDPDSGVVLQPVQDYLHGIQSGNPPRVSYDPRVNVPDGGCALPDGSFVNCSINAGAYEGIAFWARSFDPAGGLTTKTVSIALADKDTYFGIGSTCVNCCGTNGVEGGLFTAASGSMTSTTVYGFSGGGAIWYPIPCPAADAAVGYFDEAGPGIISALAPQYCCGNNFTYYSLQTTAEWAFYTLPWSLFHQAAQPTRRPEGFDPQTVFQLLISVPKEARLSLWIHDIAFYRAKQSDAGADASP